MGWPEKPVGHGKKAQNPPAVKVLGYGWIRKSERVIYRSLELTEGAQNVNGSFWISGRWYFL